MKHTSLPFTSLVPGSTPGIRRFVLTVVTLAILALGPLGATEQAPETAAVAPEVASHRAAIEARGSLVMLAVPHQYSVFIRTNLDAGPMPTTGAPERFRGIDLEIMKLFADTLGVELEVRPARGADGIPGYGALIPQLLEGRGDIIASSFTITPGRLKTVDFSPPYYTVRPVVIAPKTKNWSGLEDLVGATGSTIAGSSHEEIFDDLGIPPENRLYVEFMMENYDEVDQNTAEFTIVDSTSAVTALKDFPLLKFQFDIPGREDHYGFAVPQGSDLLPALTEFIEHLVASGELQTILDASFADYDS